MSSTYCILRTLATLGIIRYNLVAAASSGSGKSNMDLCRAAIAVRHFNRLVGFVAAPIAVYTTAERKETVDGTNCESCAINFRIAGAGVYWASKGIRVIPPRFGGANNDPDSVPEFKIYNEARIMIQKYSGEAVNLNFSTIRDFKWCMKCGGDVLLEYHDKEFSITHTSNGQIRISQSHK